MENASFLALAVFASLSLVTASSGYAFAPGAWYREIRKPRWKPPDRLFSPAWRLIFVMIAIAGWRVWTLAPAEALTPAMAAFGAQLVLNALWPYLFFYRRRPDLAFANLAALWIAIAVCVVQCAAIDVWAAALMGGYLGWVSFAGALNIAVWRMNRGAIGECRSNGPTDAEM